MTPISMNSKHSNKMKTSEWWQLCNMTDYTDSKKQLKKNISYENSMETDCYNDKTKLYLIKDHNITKRCLKCENRRARNLYVS